MDHPDSRNGTNRMTNSYPPLLQLPHTFLKLCEQHLDSEEWNYEEQMDKVLANLLFIELVERGHITISLAYVGEAPADEFFIHSVPEELADVFATFTNETDPYNEETGAYDLEEISSIGEAIRNLPSQVDEGVESLTRLKDALKGGIDEFSGLFLLEEFFPEEGLPEETTVEETVWRGLPEKQRMMIEELRVLVSIDLE
jgi:hypothetical protein